MRKYNYSGMYFDVLPNTTTSTDLAPAISVDMVEQIKENIQTLQEALGISTLEPMAAGSQIKRYKTTVTKAAAQAAEGDEISLSKVERKEQAPLTLELKKYRKLTTAEAIQRVGRDLALNRSDTSLLREVQKDVKKTFFDTIQAAGATAADNGTTLQEAVANAWGKTAVYYEDKDATPVFFLNPMDVASYLGKANITTQTAFGFDYVENFLGMGTALLTGSITNGDVYATARENLHCAYIPQGGDVADAFDLTFDESGLIGMTHSRADDRASINTLIMSGVLFYTEDASGVIKSQIKPAANPDVGG